MELSIIIPTLDEAERIAQTIASARRLDPLEVLVVDGGSRDATRDRAEEAGARVLSAPRGRGFQLAEGFRHARGDWVLFLHADTRLDAAAGHQLRKAAAAGKVGGAFRIRFDDGGRFMGVIASGINLRSRLGRPCTGDQAQFFRRDALLEAGGVPELPLMEDVVLWQRMRGRGRLVVLPSFARTSSRRFGRRPLRTLAGMWWLRAAHRLGVSAPRLARWYEALGARAGSPGRR